MMIAGWRKSVLPSKSSLSLFPSVFPPFPFSFPDHLLPPSALPPLPHLSFLLLPSCLSNVRICTIDVTSASIMDFQIMDFLIVEPSSPALTNLYDPCSTPPLSFPHFHCCLHLPSWRCSHLPATTSILIFEMSFRFELSDLCFGFDFYDVVSCI